jgi:hypothetical protein
MEFDSVLNQAAEAGKAQRVSTRRKKIGSMKVTDVVTAAMAANPDIEPADVVRAVLNASGEDWAGVDAMTDEELLRLLVTGQRALAVYRKALKGGAR